MDLLWYFVGGIALVIVFYKLVSAKPNKAASNVARRLSIKPHFVEDMISAMGAERGRMFVEHMTRWREETENTGVYTFVIYQISKNDHEKNIKWWKDRLTESGINPDIDQEEAEVAFMYLRDAGADISQISNFLKVYNSI